MIVDSVANYAKYQLGPCWRQAFEFMAGIGPDHENGEFPILCTDVFARIMSYTTRSPSEAILEAHREYVDIQVVLSGKEGLEWYPTETLAAVTDYDALKDAAFYRRPDNCAVRIKLSPGMFVALFPQDAHMPSLTIGAGDPEFVKKIVIKLKVSCLRWPGDYCS